MATGPSGVVTREGGDQFCVVFAAAEKSSAIERAERLRASIAEADVRGLHAPASSGEEVRIGASIDVACFPIDTQSADARKPTATAFLFFGVDLALARSDGISEERRADRRRE